MSYSCSQVIESDAAYTATVAEAENSTSTTGGGTLIAGGVQVDPTEYAKVQEEKTAGTWVDPTHDVTIDKKNKDSSTFELSAFTKIALVVIIILVAGLLIKIM